MRPTLLSVDATINLLIDSVEAFIFDLNVSENRTKADEVLLLAMQEGTNKILKHYRKTNWVYFVALILDTRQKL